MNAIQPDFTFGKKERMMNQMQPKTRDTRLAINCLVLLAVLLTSALTALAQSAANQPARRAGDRLAQTAAASAAAAANAASRRDDALVTILAPARRDSAEKLPVQIIVALGPRADASTFRARLNRQDITAHFARQGNAMIASVTAQHGLTPGNNRLRVEVRGLRGAQATDARRFTVTVKSPVADAGTDRKHKVGQTVRLDGTGSQPSPPPGAAPLAHKWVLVSRPVGSQAALSDPSSPTPQFVADKVGTYIAQLVVNNGLQDSAPDQVSISVHDNLPLIPLEATQFNTGEGCGAFFAIKVNGTLYPGPDGSCLGYINVVTFTRDTFDLVEHFTVVTSTSRGTGDSQGMSELTAFLDRILDTTQEPRDLIVVMATSIEGLGGDVSTIAPQLEKLGATGEFRDIHNNISFSLVGARGLKKGEAYQIIGQAPSTPSGNANIAGYFAQDSHKNYTFVQFDYLPYLVKSSTTLQGATIQIGGHTYTPQAAPDSTRSGGFHVVVVDRANPTGPPRLNKTYFTSNTSNGPGDRQLMYDDLSQYWNDETALVFVNGFGQPFAYHESLSRLIARRLHMIGGTYDIVQGLGPADTYALVGTASPDIFKYPELALYQGPEASTHQLQSTVIKGVLGRGHRGGWYSPVSAGAAEELDLGLYTIVGQPTESWAFPVGDDQQRAYEWIGKQICSECTGDVRSTYSNTNISISTLHDNLNSLNYPTDSSPDFTEAAFTAVKRQWLDEMGNVINIRLFQQNLSELWAAQQSNISLLLTGVGQEVKEAVKPKPEAKAPQIFDTLIDTIVKTTGEVVSELTEAPLVGLFEGVLNITKILAKDPEGTSATEKVESTVATLADDAVKGFNEQLAGLGSMFEMIYHDPGKIRGLGQKLASGGPQWEWQGTTTTSQLLEVFGSSARLSYYQSLVATVYAVREMVVDYESNGPNGFCRYNIIGGCSRDYTGFPPESYNIDLSWIEAINEFQQTGPRNIIPFLTQLENDTGKPDQALLQKLYQPESGGGLGVLKSYLLRRWPFERIYCTPNYSEQSTCGDANNRGPLLPEQLGPSGLGQP